MLAAPAFKKPAGQCKDRETSMSIEANKALMLRLNEAIAAGRLGELEGHPRFRGTSIHSKECN
jgi:hypothetical protein